MRILKKIISAFLAVALSLSLCACGEDHTVEYVHSAERLLQSVSTQLPYYTVSSEYLDMDHRFVVEATANRDYFTAQIEENFSDKTSNLQSLATEAMIARFEKDDMLDNLIKLLKTCVADLEDNTDVDVIIFYKDKSGTRHEY